MSKSRNSIRMPAVGAAVTALTAGAFIMPATAQAAHTTSATTTASVSTASTSQAAPAAATLTSAQRSAVRNAVVRKKVMRTAASLKGRPYRYGATGPRAFDCSGYTRYVFARNGVKLPRTSQAQYSRARKISKSSARPGDLVFLKSGSRVTHVGIYAGNGRMWHSPRAGKSVRLIKIWTPRWTAGRVI